MKKLSSPEDADLSALVLYSVEEHIIRAIPRNQGKGRNAVLIPWNGSLRASSGERLRCTRLNWSQPVLHSHALPYTPPEMECLSGKEIEQLVKPVHESLDKIENRLGELEKACEGAYAAIREQITSMAGGQDQLRSETANLVRARRQPQARG